MEPENISGKEFRPDCLAARDPETRRGAMDSASAGGCGGGGARYKLMSPAMLPISRSTCITIPPGLSPTSFLESPILLSNIKAEPSPTTGSLFKPQPMHGSFSSSSYSGSTTRLNTFEEKNSSEFEFRPALISNMVSAEVDKPRSEHSRPCPSVQTTLSGSYLDESVQTSQNDQRGNAPTILADDGYNWRKYGQKHVKGSEFPRSYYKCTHPNCEVKKLFERSHEGQITEIIYKGTHDHPKPQPTRRNSGGMSVPEERPDKLSSLIARDEKGGSMYSNMSLAVEQNGNPEVSPVSGHEDGGEVAASSRNNDDVEDDDPFAKRRRMDNCMEITPLVKPIREPRVVVQTLSEVDILDDGYRWRKYGQKVVRGNPNPRSYYKCTAAGCPVRKHVERASHDPKAVITTYEGKHNHDVPMAKSSNHDVAAGNGSATARFRPDEADTISLDLGVGMSSCPDRTSNEHQTQQLHHQTRINEAAFRFVHAAAPMAPYYAAFNGGLNQYGSRQSPNEAHTSDSNHSSYPYPQNIGRVEPGLGTE